MPESLAQLAGYYFDTASSTSEIQLDAMKSFIGTGQMLIGTDFMSNTVRFYLLLKLTCQLDPYASTNESGFDLKTVQLNGKFTNAEMAQINSKNTLAIFPRISAKLGW